VVREGSSSADYFDWARTRALAVLEGDQMVFQATCPLQTSHGLCAIYEDRPKACADFPPGHPLCLASIRLRRPSYAEELKL